MDIAVAEYVRKLDNIFVIAKGIDKDNDELRSHMAKYLCIRISGLMETFFKRKIANYLHGKAPKPVENYVNNMFKTFSSVNTNKIAKTIGGFSNDWERDFCEIITEKQRASLDAIIANRHNLAHGKDQGLTLKQIEEHYNEIKKVMEIVELIIA